MLSLPSPSTMPIDDTLCKARAKSRYWERKAKEGNERATSAEKERDES